MEPRRDHPSDVGTPSPGRTSPRRSWEFGTSGPFGHDSPHQFEEQFQKDQQRLQREIKDLNEGLKDQRVKNAVFEKLSLKYESLAATKFLADILDEARSSTVTKTERQSGLYARIASDFASMRAMPLDRIKKLRYERIGKQNLRVTSAITLEEIRSEQGIHCVRLGENEDTVLYLTKSEYKDASLRAISGWMEQTHPQSTPEKGTLLQTMLHLRQGGQSRLNYGGWDIYATDMSTSDLSRQASKRGESA